MDLIYAKPVETSNSFELYDTCVIDELISFEMLQKLSDDIDDNDFELQIDKSTWLNNEWSVGGWVYAPNTEWVGRIENIEHNNGVVKLTGPTLRGILARYALLPPSHFNKSNDPYVRVKGDIASVPEFLISTYTSEANAFWLKDTKKMFNYSKQMLGTNVDFQFRYTKTLKALNQIGMLYNHRLDLKHVYGGDKPFVAMYEPIRDLSDIISFDNDYNVGVSSKIEKSKSFNVVVGLGGGELANRDTITRYRLPNGNIVSSLTASQKENFEAKVYVYDYGSVETLEELEKGVIEKLLEFRDVEAIGITIEPEDELFLGDIVGGYDDVTGLRVKEQVTEKRLTISSGGVDVEYKVGGE